jgi:hypothetical protein
MNCAGSVELISDLRLGKTTRDIFVDVKHCKPIILMVRSIESGVRGNREEEKNQS